MWQITKEFKFEAAHQLMHHDGKCARLHGHSYTGRVTILRHNLIQDGPKTGMVADYGDIKAILTPIIDQYLDHRFLNETLKSDATTAEFIASWLWHMIQAKITALGHGVELVSVEIDETCTSSASFSFI